MPFDLPVDELIYAKEYLRLFTYAGLPRSEDLRMPTKLDRSMTHRGLLLSEDGRSVTSTTGALQSASSSLVIDRLPDSTGLAASNNESIKDEQMMVARSRDSFYTSPSYSEAYYYEAHVEKLDGTRCDCHVCGLISSSDSFRFSTLNIG